MFIGEGTIIEHGAMIKGPAWIGANCHVRNGCYVRENVIVGDDAVLGNSCEFKNCLLFDGVQVPHFNYVGDSILGYKSHLGAGAILSNVKLDHGEIVIETDGGKVNSGLRKFGAILGDHAEIGCNAVLNPGSIIGGVRWCIPARSGAASSRRTASPSSVRVSAFCPGGIDAFQNKRRTTTGLRLLHPGRQRLAMNPDALHDAEREHDDHHERPAVADDRQRQTGNRHE